MDKKAHWLLALMALSIVGSGILGCTPEYYARRQAYREARIASRQQRVVARQQQRAAQEQARLQQVCGDPQHAFMTGHNAGLQRQPMDTRWLSPCPPAAQQSQSAAYMQGYQQGIARAPSTVVVAPTPVGVYVAPTSGGYAAPAASACRISSDCGPDMSCRQWGGAGGSVCMGHGPSGSPCWFGSDCLSGWCNGGGGSGTCR